MSHPQQNQEMGSLKQHAPSALMYLATEQKFDHFALVPMTRYWPPLQMVPSKYGI